MYRRGGTVVRIVFFEIHNCRLAMKFIGLVHCTLIKCRSGVCPSIVGRTSSILMFFPIPLFLRTSLSRRMSNCLRDDTKRTKSRERSPLTDGVWLLHDKESAIRRLRSEDLNYIYRRSSPPQEGAARNIQGSYFSKKKNDSLSHPLLFLSARIDFLKFELCRGECFCEHPQPPALVLPLSNEDHLKHRASHGPSSPHTS